MREREIDSAAVTAEMVPPAKITDEEETNDNCV
jgi:hypothetical protein